MPRARSLFILLCFALCLFFALKTAQIKETQLIDSFWLSFNRLVWTRQRLSSIQPTTEELADLTLCAQRLWELDDNRLQPGIDYTINPQGGKRTSDREDAARRNLFTKVSECALQHPTYALIISLLDNYERETGTTENVTQTERQETSDFLDALLETRPIQYARNYLISTRRLANRAAFRKRLYDIWFRFYERDGPNDSSGFEHVFVGESDSNQVAGLHNWIQFYREEKRGSIDYRGYILPSYQADPPDGSERIMSLQFLWDGELKRISSLFIGSSPEFEIALYTLYFLAGESRTRVTLLNYSVEIRCYGAGSGQIGTAYPAIVNEFQDCWNMCEHKRRSYFIQLNQI